MKGNKRFLSPYSTGNLLWNPAGAVAAASCDLRGGLDDPKQFGHRQLGQGLRGLVVPDFCRAKIFVCGMGFLHIFLLQGAKDLGKQQQSFCKILRCFLPKMGTLFDR